MTLGTPSPHSHMTLGAPSPHSHMTLGTPSPHSHMTLGTPSPHSQVTLGTPSPHSHMTLGCIRGLFTCSLENVVCRIVAKLSSGLFQYLPHETRWSTFNAFHKLFGLRWLLQCKLWKLYLQQRGGRRHLYCGPLAGQELNGATPLRHFYRLQSAFTLQLSFQKVQFLQQTCTNWY